MQLSAATFSQTVTLQAKNSPLREVLKQISQQTGYDIVGNTEMLRGTKRLNVTLTKATLNDALQTVFDGQPLAYEIRDGNIFLSRKEERKTSTPNVRVAREHAASQQTVVVRGRVTDERASPIEGVTVSLKGAAPATTTNSDGRYEIRIPEGGESSLLFTAMGFETAEHLVKSQHVVDVVLKVAVSDLDEVVVVGYGTQLRRDLTGAIARVKSEELTSYPATNVIQALSGRVSGVQVTQNSGAPGSPVSIRIRGTNSIQGNNEPLYVVDGFPISGSPTMLSNNDIESVEILKDASATAIYGSRGANGVVLISTKKGKAGATAIHYDGSLSYQSVRKKLEFMTPLQYGQFYNEKALNDGTAPFFSESQLSELAAMGVGTDWQDEVLRTAPMHNHSISLSGGGERTQYSLSASAFRQEGIVRNTDYNRNTLRTFVKTNISDKLSLQYNGNLSLTGELKHDDNVGGRGASLFSGMISVPASLSPYTSDGKLTVPILSYPFISNSMINPLNYLYERSDKQTGTALLNTLALSYEPVSGLTIKISGGLEKSISNQNRYTTTRFVNSDGRADVGNRNHDSWLSENTVTYEKQVNSHHFTALAGFTYQDFVTKGMNASGTGFISDNSETFDLGAAALTNPSSSFFTKSALLSFLGRLNYNFASKYLLTLSFRADGSSRYGDGGKWGYFPSGSFAWRISDEEFLKDNATVSDMKLRVGYGTIGSQAVEPYTTLNQLISQKAVFDDALQTAYAPGTRLPNTLKWETTYQGNIGIDVSLFRNRMNFTVDYYSKITKDLLNNVQLPSSFGYTTTIRNIGEIGNNGVELSADVDVLSGESPVKWRLGGNISFNRNKVRKLYNGQDIFGTSYYTGLVGDYVNLIREGEPLGIFFGYREKGYTENGNIAFDDRNNDGTLNTLDKTIIGNPHPDFLYGLNTSVSYKGFELAVFLQGSEGNDIFNFSATQSVDLNQGLNLLEEQFHNHWVKDDPSTHQAKYPAVTKDLTVGVSDRFLEDGSYLRVKNIQLAYTFDALANRWGWLNGGQIYVSGQNLITLTNYSWFDPEISTEMSGNSVNLGIDRFGYPTAKTITFGLRMGLNY